MCHNFSNNERPVQSKVADKRKLLFFFIFKKISAALAKSLGAVKL